jgi:hypothetical protein
MRTISSVIPDVPQHLSQPDRCGGVLDTLLRLGEAGTLPWVLLRPRDTNGPGIYEGDFDLLADPVRFDTVLATIFAVCRAAGVSFVLRQQAAFKRQVELLEADGRRVTLELWPHAEFRVLSTRGPRTRWSRGAISYETWRSMDEQGRTNLLGALFILHLHHKRKDLNAPLVRERLRAFQELKGLASELQQTIAGLALGSIDADTAQNAALAWLHARRVPIESPWRLLRQRAAVALRGALHWPSLRTTAVLGPDGSGKSALIEFAKSAPTGARYRFQRFKRFFRRPLWYVVTSEPRNVRDEKVLWLILPVAWLYFCCSRVFTGWRRPLLLDRYFYDYFVRNVRSETEPLRRIAAYGACSALAPRPCALVVAMCPTTVILARKQEMTADAIEGMYELYLDQVRRARVPRTLFCHTGVEQETSARQVVQFLEEAA